MTKRRVVVTGLGLISPVGNDVGTAWNNVVEGRSGIGPIEDFDATGFSTNFAGCIKDFDATKYLAAKEVRKVDPFIHYGIAAAEQAVEQSAISTDFYPGSRVGVAMGSGIGGLHTIEQNYQKYADSGSPRKISPFFVPGSIINMISGHISIRHGFQGPNIALVTACTSATHSIGIAARTIAYGDADAMLAGGGEAPITILGLGGFCSARALSKRNDDPQAASRPWDIDRDGFVLAAGGACLVLEEYESAQKRGAEILAEVSGFGMSGDAHHITAPAEDGAGAVLCMRSAVQDSGLDLDDISYINAHGTSTPLGDIAETCAIKSVFGRHAQQVAISSTKSTTGHLLGAAGAIEAVFSVMSIVDQVAPPTINLTNPDPQCDLDYVPGEARRMEIKSVLTNSFGFGGTNGSLIFTRI
ncbi:MAG TPA: beta-ketoacyl-ACP synthase II [Gammaproteobacteria bacterium]|jgi:3-oxoacyl-[acyl-carrier-protein] synthase II|nr:beta-ketoacyl-ACP synthase II [Gammaproteobacteria bacterium]MDP7660126.1 beta-ketoacyl-ACP synthase II [Gammaproteobacteria bacterium]HJP39871.1 beta-ketoacyl-ACP synthase II [Gammaproteobacteria bacterium]